MYRVYMRACSCVSTYWLAWKVQNVFCRCTWLRRRKLTSACGYYEIRDLIRLVVDVVGTPKCFFNDIGLGLRNVPVETTKRLIPEASLQSHLSIILPKYIFILIESTQQEVTIWYSCQSLFKTFEKVKCST